MKKEEEEEELGKLGTITIKSTGEIANKEKARLVSTTPHRTFELER